MTTAPPRPRTESVALPNRPATVLFARWGLILACTLVAFGPAVLRTFEDYQTGGLLAYLVLKPLMALAAATGIARRRRDKVQVYDREVDAIVGGLCLAFSAAVVAFLVPRYAENFLLLRIDLFGFWIFVFGACCLMFGLRAAAGYWPVWLMLMLLAPAPYRVLVTALGGGWVAASTALLLDAALAITIAVARTRLRALVGFVTTMLAGRAIMAVLLIAGAPKWQVQLVPAVVAGALVSFAFIVYTTRIEPVEAPHIPQRPSVVKAPWKSAVALVAVSVLFLLLPRPDVQTRLDPPVGPTTTPPGGGQTVSTGWTQDWIEHYPWAVRYFGQDATVTRQQFTTNEVVPEWDEKGRKRTITVDTVRTHEPITLIVNSVYSMYDAVEDRRSPVIPVDLGDGVTGYFGTVVDDELLLTWSGLSWEWERAGATERVTLISVDNHDPGAPFPQMQLSVLARLTLSLTILLRGNESVQDLASQYKDRDMLTEVATELVDSQMATNP